MAQNSAFMAFILFLFLVYYGTTLKKNAKNPEDIKKANSFTSVSMVGLGIVVGIWLYNAFLG